MISRAGRSRLAPRHEVTVQRLDVDGYWDHLMDKGRKFDTGYDHGARRHVEEAWLDSCLGCQ